MAKLGAVIERWMVDTELDMTAIQCWTSMEEYFGIVPCTIMSMMSDKLMSSACETDVAGVVGMYAMALASGKPSALVDWNNNYGEDPNKCVVFHCSNLPAQVFDDIPVMEYQEIIAGTVGAANTYGTMYGRVKADPVTYSGSSRYVRRKSLDRRNMMRRFMKASRTMFDSSTVLFSASAVSRSTTMLICRVPMRFKDRAT